MFCFIIRQYALSSSAIYAIQRPWAEAFPKLWALGPPLISGTPQPSGFTLHIFTDPNSISQNLRPGLHPNYCLQTIIMLIVNELFLSNSKQHQHTKMLSLSLVQKPQKCVLSLVCNYYLCMTRFWNFWRDLFEKKFHWFFQESSKE